jgi:HEPN domain-containing protein
VRKAEADYLVAKKSARSASFHDAVCFHCQQCAEKYLKAFLVEASLTFPKTHDLDRIRAIAVPQYPSVQMFRRGLLFLTSFAVETRYPGFDASERQAAAAVRWTERVRKECRSLLNIDKPRRKRKRL